MSKKGKITVDGIVHEVEVLESGERLIDGKPIDDFLDSLSVDSLRRLAKVGWFRFTNEATDAQEDDGIYQEKLSELEFLDY